jgi:hypothetical protein
VRDYLQYLKAAKSLLLSEDKLFALSDVIEEVNCSAVIAHLMHVYESIVVGKTVVEKIGEQEDI